LRVLVYSWRAEQSQLFFKLLTSAAAFRQRKNLPLSFCTALQTAKKGRCSELIKPSSFAINGWLTRADKRPAAGRDMAIRKTEIDAIQDPIVKMSRVLSNI
jgi:hypothetical protein